MALSRPHAVLFDWDNTLTDSWLPIYSALEKTFFAMGQKPWTLEETKQKVRASARDAFPVLFGKRAEEAMAVFYAAYEDNHAKAIKALDGAKELLDALAKEKILLAVVSNKKGILLRKEVGVLGWDDYFYSIIGANDAPRDKPARAALDLALRGTGLAFSTDVWFVGDTDIDMICARNHGCLPILIRKEPPTEDEFPGCEPAFHFGSCGDFCKALPF